MPVSQDSSNPKNMVPKDRSNVWSAMKNNYIYNSLYMYIYIYAFTNTCIHATATVIHCQAYVVCPNTQLKPYIWSK